MHRNHLAAGICDAQALSWLQRVNPREKERRGWRKEGGRMEDYTIHPTFLDVAAPLIRPTIDRWRSVFTIVTRINQDTAVIYIYRRHSAVKSQIKIEGMRQIKTL